MEIVIFLLCLFCAVTSALAAFFGYLTCSVLAKLVKEEDISPRGRRDGM